MTDQEKLNKIKEILQNYQGQETIFGKPARETKQQQAFREDLQTISSLVFDESLGIPADLSVAELKKRIQTIWQETKPKDWSK
jgi:hypothetical protein